MTAALCPPSPVRAIAGDDLARVDEWAALQRVELSRLALALRSAEVKAERAERDLAPDESAPEDLLAVLDSMLDTAVRAAEAAVEAARRQAAATVVAERDRATDHLRALGRDPLVVLGPPGWTSTPVPDLVAPPPAATLWRRTAEPEPVEELPAVAEVIELFDDPEPVPMPAHPARRLVSAAVGQPPPSVAEDVELFDAFWRGPEEGFWGEADSNRRPIRERWRRRVPEALP